jgi:hypothetical protein
MWQRIVFVCLLFLLQPLYLYAKLEKVIKNEYEKIARQSIRL